MINNLSIISSILWNRKVYFVPSFHLATNSVPLCILRTLHTSFTQVKISLQTNTLFSVPKLISVITLRNLCRYTAKAIEKCSIFAELAFSFNKKCTLHTSAMNSIPYFIVPTRIFWHTFFLYYTPFISISTGIISYLAFLTVPMSSRLTRKAFARNYGIKSWQTLTIDTIENRLRRTLWHDFISRNTFFVF